MSNRDRKSEGTSPKQTATRRAAGRSATAGAAERAISAPSSLASTAVETLLVFKSEKGTTLFVGALLGLFLLSWFVLMVGLAALLLPFQGGTVGPLQGWLTLIAAAGLTGYVGYAAHRRDERRSRAAELSRYPSEDVVGEAVGFLDSDDVRTRGYACSVLYAVAADGAGTVVKNSNRRPEWIVDRAVDLLSVSEREPRAAAAALVRSFSREYPGAVIEHGDTLASALRYRDTAVQAHLAYAIGNLGHEYPDEREAFVDPLVDCLDDPDKDVRIAACNGLRRLGGEDVAADIAPPLEETRAEDSHPDVREAADKALRAIG